jgi:hypothetical protein
MTKIAAIVFTALTLVLAPAAVASGSSIESHRIIGATAVAQRCLGYRATLWDEITLAQIVRTELNQRISSWDVNSALRSARSTDSRSCESSEATEGASTFKEEILPLLRESPLNNRRNKANS